MINSTTTATPGSNPVIVMTLEQLKLFASEIAREMFATGRFSPLSQQPRQEEDEEVIVRDAERYAYGLQGIMRLFGVSHSTAQVYKKTFLAPAITQRGRKIVIDKVLARALFAEHKQDEGLDPREGNPVAREPERSAG